MPSTFAKRSAVGGVVVWLATLLLTTADSAPTELIHKVVFFAVLVVVQPVATHTLILTIPTMAMTHGLLNAFGFVTCSLFAWSQIAPREFGQKVVDFTR